MPGDYDIWEVVGDQIKDNYTRQYITPEKFMDESNPIAGFVATPGLDNFYGTKVLNICIVNHPFGWQRNGDGELEDKWDELILPQVTPTIERHKETYGRYAQYKTRVWIDFYYVLKQEEADPESKAREMLTAVSSKMSDICTQLAEHGWEFMGHIDTAPEWTFFQEYIDEFYGINS
jgi:hypothetical protein